MNFLAHIFLSDNDEALMIGNFIADFVKGNALRNYAPKIQEGIRLHRQIDSYTDRHTIVRQSIQRLQPDFGRYAGVIVDIFYDHFLATHFSHFSSTDLVDFAENAYLILEKHFAILPPKVQEFLPYMRTQNWLVRYGDLEGIRRSLIGVSQRAKFADNLDSAIANLQKDYEAFAQDFRDFFPELWQMTQDWIAP
jgi:acyl carrier protein phosphodiesterase